MRQPHTAAAAYCSSGKIRDSLEHGQDFVNYNVTSKSTVVSLGKLAFTTANKKKLEPNKRKWRRRRRKNEKIGAAGAEKCRKRPAAGAEKLTVGGCFLGKCIFDCGCGCGCGGGVILGG